MRNMQKRQSHFFPISLYFPIFKKKWCMECDIVFFIRHFYPKRLFFKSGNWMEVGPFMDGGSSTPHWRMGWWVTNSRLWGYTFWLEERKNVSHKGKNWLCVRIVAAVAAIPSIHNVQVCGNSNVTFITAKRYWNWNQT